MTQIEQIKAEIERLYNEEAERFDTSQEIGAKRILDKLDNFINSLPAEQPSEELEEEIDRVVKEVVTPEVIRDYVQGFKAGAQWQKEQMMKSAIEVKINRDTLYNLKPIIHEKYQDLKIGDKILIIKEAEQ